MENGIEKKETAEKKAGATPKKKALIISLSVLAVLLIVGGILLGVLLPRTANQGDVRYRYRSYYFAVDMAEDGKAEFTLPTDWITEGKIDKFKVSNSMPDYVEVEGGVAKLKGLPQGNNTLTCVIEFYKDEQKAATVNLFFTKADKHITNLAELRAIPNGDNKTYSLDADLDFGGGAFRLEEFRGNFYGNNHTLSRLNISGQSKGGMFGHLFGGRIYGLNIAEVRCTYSGSDVTFGVLADEAYGTDFGYCTLSGEANVTPLGGINRIGGLVGRYYDVVRSEYLDGMQFVMENCSSTMNLTVNRAEGRVSVGGLVGVAENVKLTGVRTSGNLKVSINGTALTDFAYVGGVVGQWTRTYKTPPLIVKVFDLAYNVTGTGDVSVSVTGEGITNTVFAGGLMGYLGNQQLYGAKYLGKLNVESAGWHVSVGGIGGRAENSLVHAGITMSVSASGIKSGEYQGEVKVTSEGVVWAGGLFGWGKGIRAEDLKNDEILPEVTGGNEQNKTGKIYGYQP